MQPRDRLHAVIDKLSDYQTDALLAQLEAEMADPAPLTEAEIASIRRGIEQLDRGEGIRGGAPVAGRR